MGERIRRIAAPQVYPRVEVIASEAVEAIIGLNLANDTQVRCENYDIGCEWFEKSRTAMSEELRTRLAPLSESQSIHALWHTLLAAVADAPADLPGFIRHLEAMPADDFWLQALGYHDHHDPSPELREATLAAGRGSLEPLERILGRDPERRGHWIHGLARALGGDAEATRQRVIDVLGRWHDDVFAAQWTEIAPIVERDAEEKTRLARQRPPAEVIEEATNGGEYVPEVGIGRLLLIPTYLCRPWMIQSRQRGTLVIVYPIGESALAPSAEEAQRQRVLRLAKALSDDTRLRALRLMGRSAYSLLELADELGVRKSTMHHHLSVLRSAGLLRMRFFEKRYSLRTSTLDQMSVLLGDYLGDEESRRRKR